MVQIPLTADSEITAFGRDLGAGTAFPASGPANSALRRGDVCFRTDYGGLFIWTGTAWRQRGPCELTNAQRLALATAGLHPDFRVWETDKLREWAWTGAAWAPILGGTDWALMPVVGAPYFIHNAIAAGDTVAPGPSTPGLQYRREGDRVFLRGIAYTNTTTTASASGSSPFLATALAAEFRPPVTAYLYTPTEVAGTVPMVRFEMGSNGQLYCAKGLATGTYCFFDGMSYSLS